VRGHGDGERDGVRDVVGRERSDLAAPAGERLARARAGLEPFMPFGAAEIVVATHAGEAPAPPEADLAVDSLGGGGITELRARVLAGLRQPAAERA
jgi:hypothetical protein